MNEICLQAGIERALDALLAERLALICGAGLSMAAPSSIPGAAVLAESAKEKYDATFGADRPPLPVSIDDQAQFFFERRELATVYLRSYIDQDIFATHPNAGHFAIADLMLIRGITTAVSTNVDTLIETAGSMLYGQIGAGVSRANVASLSPEKSPLLKIHGCWSEPGGTIWARGQIAEEPTRTRIDDCGQWLEVRLLDRDLLIIGYWTDWDYLNQILEAALSSVTPSRVTVVDPAETHTFEPKAPALYELGQRATTEFCHVRCSGHIFLDKLRVAFSRSFIRRILQFGKREFTGRLGYDPEDLWLEPSSEDAGELWLIRRDLEGCNPNNPSKLQTPTEEPLLGMTILQLQARGAVSNGSYWDLNGKKIRVIRAANRALHEVESTFAGETPPAIAPDVVVAVGAESVSLPASIVRGSADGSVVRGSATKWLSRGGAIEEYSL